MISNYLAFRSLEYVIQNGRRDFENNRDTLSAKITHEILNDLWDYVLHYRSFFSVLG